MATPRLCKCREFVDAGPVVKPPSDCEKHGPVKVSLAIPVVGVLVLNGTHSFHGWTTAPRYKLLSVLFSVDCLRFLIFNGNVGRNWRAS